MKVKKKDNIRYRFTGYVLAALKRAKRDYICREIKISNHESPLEKLLPEPLHLGMDYKKAASVFNYAKKKMRKGWKIRNEF